MNKLLPKGLPQSILTGQSSTLISQTDCYNTLLPIIRAIKGDCSFSSPETTRQAATQIMRRVSPFYTGSAVPLSVYSQFEMPIVIPVNNGAKLTYRSNVGVKFTLHDMLDAFQAGYVPTADEWDQFQNLVPASVDLTGTAIQVDAATNTESVNTAAATIVRTVDADDGDEVVSILGYEVTFDWSGASSPGDIVIGTEQGGTPTAYNEKWAILRADTAADCTVGTVFIPTIAQQYDRSGDRFFGTVRRITERGAGRFGAYFTAAGSAQKLADADITVSVRVIPITQDVIFSLIPTQEKPSSFFTR